MNGWVSLTQLNQISRRINKNTEILIQTSTIRTRCLNNLGGPDRDQFTDGLRNIVGQQPQYWQILFVDNLKVDGVGTRGRTQHLISEGIADIIVSKCL